jgi:hypothetical protein
MARDFLAGLDPNASKFTFQFFSDSGGCHPEVFHGTLDAVWPKVQALNTPQQGVGVFVTVSETDFKGRSTKNVLQPRALFVDADNKTQISHCMGALKKYGAKPSMIVKSGRGLHFYFVCPDIPLDQFSALQTSLIEKLRTDPAVKDLPRVMRLPGTLHLKNPSKARLVELYPMQNPVRRWQLSELVAKFGLAPTKSASNKAQHNNAHLTPANPRLSPDQELTPVNRERLKKFFGHLAVESLSDGLKANIEEIRSAVLAIPPSAISTEPEWMRFARGLAHEAAVYENQAEELWEILDTASRLAPGYNEEDNRRRWLRHISEAFNRDNPITIATVFNLAKQHGWQGWSSPLTTAPAPVIWSAADLKVSLANIPHRRWLYGTYLIRGEITVVAAPGGLGKTALATGMAVEIATGTELLGEKIFGSDLKVLFINGEDGSAEITRRILAFCLAHANKIAGRNLDRVYVAGADNPRVQRLSFLKTDKNFSSINQSGFEVLEAALRALRPDLVILDPLVAFCGGGNMNDNAVMSLVIRELKHLAAQFDCAVLVVHHTRKGAEDGNAEAISGAAATVNLARRAIMPVLMTEREALSLGVLPSERFRFFKLVDAKSNLAPRSADSPWYRLHSVELPNSEPPIYPHGDNVQAVERANLLLPNIAGATADDQKIQRAILDLVDRGKMIDGQSYPYSPSTAGADNERSILDDAMAAIVAATAPRDWRPDDLKAVTAGAIKKMKTEGLLAAKDMKELAPGSGRFRRGRGLTVHQARMPQAKESVEDSVPDHATALDGGQSVNDPFND